MQAVVWGTLIAAEIGNNRADFSLVKLLASQLMNSVKISLLRKLATRH
jgi:hypothetical protein